MNEPVFLIAGGGTGGHVFPGLAVADALKKLSPVRVVFVGAPRGLESRIVPMRGYPLELLDVEPMKGGGPARAARGAAVAAKATLKARALVSRYKPRAILSVGGYAAGPMSLAGALAGVPLAVLEPNRSLGLANKILAPFAKRAYVAFGDTSGAFRKSGIRQFGVPLREGFRAQSTTPEGPLQILVLGGSQGAKAINDRMPEVLARIESAHPELQVLHQVGSGQEDQVRAAYGARSNVRVVPFIDEVAREMTRASVIVSRAGAITVAEICAIGRASVLVPFPYAAGDHQAENALALEKLGGAVCVRQADATVGRLAGVLTDLLADERKRTHMAECARAHGKPDAAMEIAKDLLALGGVREVASHEERNDERKNNGAGMAFAQTAVS
jgi:UDP-N-acetylglucosamine--N-acetylmuramyl-(pentapeptide) pyrophosphoryl-undecaprenol N-acetylglucosamine transferase